MLKANHNNTSLNVINVVIKENVMQIKNHIIFSEGGQLQITQLLLYHAHWTIQNHKLKL